MIRSNNKQINIEHFPNNEIRLRNLEFIDNTLIELKYETSDDLIALIFLKKRFDKANIKTSLFVWYMPYSRMDRYFDNDLFMLKYISEVINYLNFDKVYVLEPHSEVTEELLNNVVPIYPMNDLIDIVMKDINFTDNDHIVFPDEGSFKRYINQTYQNPLTFKKRRDESSTKIKDIYLETGCVKKNSKCIIVDDLCATGSTCVKAGNILKDMGAKEVYVLTVHTEDQVINNKITKDDSPIDKIYTTDSLLTLTHPKIEILSFDKGKYIE